MSAWIVFAALIATCVAVGLAMVVRAERRMRDGFQSLQQQVEARAMLEMAEVAARADETVTLAQRGGPLLANVGGAAMNPKTARSRGVHRDA